MSDLVIKARFSDSTSVTVGHKASLSWRLNQLDLASSRAYDGLFVSASAMNSPFMALTRDADFFSAAIEAGDELAVRAVGRGGTECGLHP